jgi:hypothetical protein
LKDVDELRVDATAALEIPLLLKFESHELEFLQSQITFDTVADNRQSLLTYTQMLNFRSNVDPEAGQKKMLRLHHLLVSQRAADGDIAASLSRLIFHEYVKNQSMLLGFGNQEALDVSNPVQFYMDQHLSLLERHITEAEKDLIRASQYFPLNGIILVLSGLIQDIDLMDNSWESFRKKLIDLCIRSCELTQFVCADASPEGNIPDKDMKHESKQKIAQILLRHCFRTIKNSTFCFVQVLSKLKLGGSAEDLTFVKKLGDLMCFLLTHVRHKGAFASVHENFAILCNMLSNSRHFAHLTQEWLELFLSQISNLQVSVTRRSAGLPSAILAVIVSPKNDVDRAKLFKRVVDVCYEIVDQPTEDRLQQLDLPQVHAMNVLRILMSDSELVFLAREHMGTCFEICLQQFSSTVFPIRNCAGMLFSTLVNKAFGTKKTKSEGEQVNLVLGREFFLRFPNLYHVLRRELATAVRILDDNQVHPLLYPILSILSRLKPFGSETEESFYSLRPFEALVLQCAKAIQWKVREISAHTIGVLVDPTRAYDVIHKIAQSIHSMSHACFVHGCLLQIESILECHVSACVAAIPEFIESIDACLYSLLPALELERNSVARYVYMRIFKKHLAASSGKGGVLSNRIAVGVITGHISVQYCPNYVFEIAAEVALSPLHIKHTTNALSSIEHLSDAALVPFLSTLSNLDSAIYSSVEDTQLIKSAVRLSMQIIEESHLPVDLLESGLKVLRIHGSTIGPSLVPSMLELLRTPRIPFSLISTLLFALVQCMPNIPDWSVYLKSCEQFSQPQMPIGLRIQVANCLFLLRNSTSRGHSSFLDYALLLDKLVQDDESSVRQIAIKCISHFLGEPISTCETNSRARFLRMLCETDQVSDSLMEMLVQRLQVSRFESIEQVLKPALFDAEDLNTFEDAILNIFLFHSCIENVIPKLSDSQKVKLLESLDRMEQAFVSLQNHAEFEWVTHSPVVFELGMQAIASLQLQKTLGVTKDWKSVPMHPFLVRAFSSWNVVRSFFVPE